MNIKLINEAILKGEDIPAYVPRDDQLLKYLLDNNVAYYYAKFLSKKRGVMEEKIIEAGDKLNEKYFRTLKLINDVAKKEKIDFLLFKTYKYIPEVIDGDIDLFIKEKDFHRFLETLSKEGFKCVENESLKAFCVKSDFCTIEPRVNASFHGMIILREGEIWEDIEEVKIEGLTFKKALKRIDLLYLLLNILYGPNYLKLYLYLIVKDFNFGKDFSPNIDNDLGVIRELISISAISKHFPLFPSNISFLSWWLRRIVLNNTLSLYSKIKHLAFFFYMKYQYLLFDRLVFAHNWGISDV